MRFLPFLALLAMCFLAKAQQYEVCGRLVSKEDGEAVFGATVLVEALNTGVVSGMDGAFCLPLPDSGKYQIEVRFLGLENLKIEVQVSGKTDLNLLEMQSGSQRLIACPVYYVKYNEAMDHYSLSSSRHFSSSSISQVPGSMDDPARLALSFPGVKGSDDITGAISIRGNSPKGLTWRIEGIEIPTPSHFSTEGAVTGSVTMLSPQFMGGGDFYAGGFPAHIGNATAGAFDLTLRNGTTSGHRFNANVGMLGLQAGAQGPIGIKGSSYNIGYRYSTLGLIGDLGFNIGDTRTAYQDINFKTHIKLKSGFLNIFSIGGRSTVKRALENTETKMYQLGLAGVRYHQQLGGGALSIASVYSQSTEEYDAVLSSEPNLFFYESQNNVLRTSATYQREVGSLVSKSGVIYSHHNFKLSEGAGSPTIMPEQMWYADDAAGFTEAYSELSFASERIEVKAGMYGNYFGYNSNWSIEPRFGFAYKTGNHKYYVNTGLHSKLESMGHYMNMWVDSGYTVQPNRDLGISRAAHFVSGASFDLSRFNLKAEVYYQYLYDVPVSSNPENLYSALNYMWRYPFIPLDNDGKGRNYGLELTAERMLRNEDNKGSGDWFILSTLSAFRSLFTPADGLERGTTWDAGFISNLTGGYEFNLKKPGDVLLLSGRLLWSGGYRTEASAYAETLPNYFRTDLRLAYSIARKKADATISLDIQNITNRLNENITQDIDPVGLIPVLAVAVEF